MRQVFRFMREIISNPEIKLTVPGILVWSRKDSTGYENVLYMGLFVISASLSRSMSKK